MDGITPVGAMVQPPQPVNPIQTYASILGIQQQRTELAQQQQTLETGRAVQQQEQGEAQLKQQQMSERLKLQQALQAGQDDEGNSLRDANGELDPNALMAYANRALPLTGQGVVQNVLKTQSDKVALNSSVQGLQGKYRSDIGGIISGFYGGQATPEQISASLDQYGQQNPQAVPAIHWAENLIQHVGNAQTQQQRDTALSHVAGIFTGESPQKPSSVDVGAQIQPGTTNVASGAFSPGGAPLTKSIPPTPVTLPNQQPGVQTNAGVRVAPMLGGGPGQGSQPAANAPGYAQTGFATAQGNARQYITQVRNSDTQDYGSGTHISNVIRQLSQGTDTGPGTATWHKLLAGVNGITGSKVGDSGTDYQLINAYLDRQAAIAQQSMGIPNTNAGLQTAQTLSGTTGLTPQALRNKNDLTQALIEGAHQFRQGVDRAVGFGPNPDPAKLAQFQNAWTTNFDPNAYRLWNATQNGDQEELANLKAELGTQGLKALAVKMRALKALSSTGSPE